MSPQSKLPLIVALIPVIVLVGILGLNVLVFGDNALSFANQLALLIAASVAAIIGIVYKVEWEHLVNAAVENIRDAMSAIFILLLIGSLAGSWLIGGIVPAMVYYGLQVLSPTFFLVSCCVICAVVSLATGSSWGTIATVGIALLGIGQAMMISEGMVAGAIISGAYFGDKMSPLSDTTNLAPAVAGTELITHIRYMMITTFPSIILAMLIFTVIGLFGEKTLAETNNMELIQAIEASFTINLWLFVAPIAVIVLIVRKVPALPALAIGTLLGVVSALVFQSDLLLQIGNNGSFAKYELLMSALGGDFSIPSPNPIAADLLSTGGMAGMLPTIWLVICAMIFGGFMEKSGCLPAITGTILRWATGRVSLFGATGASCIIMNVTASDQYLSIVVPGRMFSKTFADRGLAPENLSRTLEDCGTVTSVLIPWNTCGAAQSSVLGVAVGTYWPYCFFNLISPFMTILVATLNYKIARLKSEHS